MLAYLQPRPVDVDLVVKTHRQLLARAVQDFAAEGRRPLAERDDLAVKEDLAVQRRRSQICHTQCT